MKTCLRVSCVVLLVAVVCALWYLAYKAIFPIAPALYSISGVLSL